MDKWWRANLAIDVRHGGFDFKFEGMLLRQAVEFEQSIEVLSRSGYYVQLARRIGSWEPVVRWAHALEADLHGAVAS